MNYIVTRSLSDQLEFFSEHWFCNDVYLLLRIAERKSDVARGPIVL